MLGFSMLIYFPVSTRSRSLPQAAFAVLDWDSYLRMKEIAKIFWENE